MITAEDQFILDMTSKSSSNTVKSPGGMKRLAVIQTSPKANNELRCEKLTKRKIVKLTKRKIVKANIYIYIYIYIYVCVCVCVCVCVEVNNG